jgi:4-amino-4-deoxy-L-arabinose transferase-like glycosyltransferase
MVFEHDSNEISKRLDRKIASVRIFPGDLLGLTASLLLFIYLGPFQLHPPVGWADPVIYQSYFKHYEFNLSNSPPTYFSNRFAFVLLGRALYHWFVPETANFLMIAVPMLGFAAAIHVLTGHFYGRRYAALAILLVAVNVLILAPMTQGYVNGLVIAFMLCGFTTLLVTIESRRSAWRDVLVGVFFALAILTHPIATAYIGCGLIATLISFPEARAQLVQRLLWGVTGCAAVVTSFALIGHMLNGSYDFFRPTFSDIEYDTHRFSVSFWTWGPFATRLWYLLIAAVVGLAIFIARKRLSQSSADSRVVALIVWSTLSLVMTSALMAGWDVFIGTSFFTYWFYICHLGIFTIIIFAGAIRLFSPPMVGRSLQFKVDAAIVFFATLSTILPGLTRAYAPNDNIFLVASLAGTATAVLALMLLIRFTEHPSAAAVLVCVLTVAPVLILALNPDTRHVYADKSVSYGDAMQAAHEADDFILANVQGTHPFFWYNRNSYNAAHPASHGWGIPDGEIYPLTFMGGRMELDFLDTIWFFYYVLFTNLDFFSNARSLSESNPTWNTLHASPLPITLVILSNDSDDGMRARNRLTALYDAKITMKAQRKIGHGDFAAYISIFDVTDVGRAATN